MSFVEENRSGFNTVGEAHPSEIVPNGSVNGKVGIAELREAIPAHCFEPSFFWSFFYVLRDLTYATLLVYAYFQICLLTAHPQYAFLYWPLMMLYGFIQGLVWTGFWIIAHDCCHSGFTKSSITNDIVGFTLHSFFLVPYFSFKSTHRRHHIYANNVDKDNNYVPLRRDSYIAKLGISPKQLSHWEKVTEDAPVVLFLRIILQQLIGWNWYILSNITCGPEGVPKQGLSPFRQSHFDPWGSNFRDSEKMAVILSDIGCCLTLTGFWVLYHYTGSFEHVFWLYLVPWSWVNHWIVMITYLSHTHPDIPKYSPKEWTFVLGATATMDRSFGFIGTHFFHHISTDHVTHHLFSKIPHYYLPDATKAIVPLLGKQYKNGVMSWKELKLAFSRCQWVEENVAKDDEYFGTDEKGDVTKKRPIALWYRGGRSPLPEYRMRYTSFEKKLSDVL